MTRLCLLRHADAGDPEAWAGDDAARPLTEKGRAQSERLGRFLGRTAFRPDAIITSPKLRATETAQIVAAALGADVEIDDRLAGGVDARAVEALLASREATTIVLVGHDPDFSELLMELTGASRLSMKKGAFARVDVDVPLQRGRGRLRWLVPPDLLDAG